LLQAGKLRKAALAKRKQDSYFKKMVKQYSKKSNELNDQIERKFELLEEALGSEDFAMLKDICMVTVPEVKDESGAITQEAKTELNREALLVEGRHLLVLKREDRILKGLRKRSTGRSSSRRMHSAYVKFLSQRNQELNKEL